MSDGFRKWKKQTSTSLSNRYISHYNCLLIPEEKDSKTYKFNKMMLIIHNTLMNASIYNSIPLTRWTKSDVIMLPKLQNNPQINRIRVINKVEVDFNLMLELFWPKAATRQAERRGELHKNQWEIIPRCSADHPVLINEFITDIHKLTCKNLSKL